MFIICNIQLPQTNLIKDNKILNQSYKKDIGNKIKSIIPESDMTEEYQNEFTRLFNSFEYEKGAKFPQMTFKKIISSKGLTNDKLKLQIMNNVVNQGPFLIILYPSKIEKYNKTNTFFF